MAKAYTGRDGQLLLGGTTLVKVTNWSIQAEVSMLETTSLGDAQRSFTPGIQAFSGTATLLYYKADNGSIDASSLLQKVIRTGTTGVAATDTVTLTLRLADGTDLNDITLTAYITGATIGAAVGEIVSAQISFQATGALSAAGV
ncbi:hypothetical protein EBT31_12770 [bacterium]|nr:hypothetical protein [bacterium]